MNKKVAIIGGAILLLLLGGGALLAMKRSTKAPVVTTNTTSLSNAGSTEGTLKSLFESGKSEKCTVNSKSTDSAKFSGTSYVAGGKVRVDMQGNVSGTTINSHIIIDSGIGYVWTDLSKQGFKFTVNVEASPVANSKAPDLNQTVDYSCSDWTSDGSVFVLPADVTFAALAIPSPIPAGANATGVGMSQCSICDSLPAGEAQTACKTQYHCQ